MLCSTCSEFSLSIYFCANAASCLLLCAAVGNRTSSVPRSPLRRAHFGAGRLDLKDTRWTKDQLHENTNKEHQWKHQQPRHPSRLSPLSVLSSSSLFSFVLSKFVILHLVCFHSFSSSHFFLGVCLSLLFFKPSSGGRCLCSFSFLFILLSCSPDLFSPFFIMLLLFVACISQHESAFHHSAFSFY